jgi:hypothetical protein
MAEINALAIPMAPESRRNATSVRCEKQYTVLIPVEAPPPNLVSATLFVCVRGETMGKGFNPAALRETWWGGVEERSWRPRITRKTCGKLQTLGVERRVKVSDRERERESKR